MSRTEILQLRAHTMLTFMAEDLKPFILAALLEDAGAVKVGLFMDTDCLVTVHGMDGAAPDVHGLAPDEGEIVCWLLSIQEEGGE